MFGVSQCVDGGKAGESGELLDVLLRIGADDRAMNHAAQDAGRVHDRFAAAQLNVSGIEKQGMAPEFADADFKGDARAGGGLGEQQGPDLAGQRLRFAVGPRLFHLDAGLEDVFEAVFGQCFDAQ